MPNRNVFGKRIKRFNPLLWIFLVFIIVFVSRFLLLGTMANQLEDEKRKETEVKREINAVIQEEESDFQSSVGPYVTRLPNRYQPQAIEQELRSLLMILGFDTLVRFTIEDQVSSPFQATVPSLLRSVKIEIRLAADDTFNPVELLDLLKELNRFYYVSDFEIEGWNTDYRSVRIILYTFYYEVEIN